MHNPAVWTNWGRQGAIFFSKSLLVIVYGKNKKNRITDINVSTCPAYKAACQGDWMNGFCLP